jgi:hypothetical protein
MNLILHFARKKAVIFHCFFLIPPFIKCHAFNILGFVVLLLRGLHPVLPGVWEISV